MRSSVVLFTLCVVLSQGQVFGGEAFPLPAVHAAAGRSAGPADLKSAILANDRAAFDAALAHARAAGTATRLHEDIATLWDAQFEAPFFSSESGAYRVASRYPGWEEAVRRQILTDDRGRKFYPAAESRAFLARQLGSSSSAPRAAAGRRTRLPKA